jgi:hypothetical protein
MTKTPGVHWTWFQPTSYLLWSIDCCVNQCRIGISTHAESMIWRDRERVPERGLIGPASGGLCRARFCHSSFGSRALLLPATPCTVLPGGPDADILESYVRTAQG